MLPYFSLFLKQSQFLYIHLPPKQAKSEISELKQHLTDVASDIRKVDAAVNEEARQSRQVENDAKWAIDGIKEQFANQRDQLQQHQQRIEGVMNLVTMEAQEREALAASIKQAFESSIHGLSDQNIKRLEVEIGKRHQLTQDIVNAFKKLRDEIGEGFQMASESQKEAEKALRSVESILRAEIRTRMQSLDMQTKQISSIDQRTANDSQVLVTGLRELDDSTTKAISEIRNSLSGDYRTALEQIATRVHELQEGLMNTNSVVKELQQLVGESRAAMIEVKKENSDLKSEQTLGTASEQTLRKELTTLFRNEVESLTTRIQSLNEEVTNLRDDNLELRAEVKLLRRDIKVTTTGSNTSFEDIHEELGEALEASARERKAIVTQMQKGFESEREQWEAVTRKLHEEIIKKGREDKAAQKDLRSNIRELKAALLENTEPEKRVVTFQETQAETQETADLRRDVDNLLDTVSRVEVRLEGLKKYGKETEEKASAAFDSSNKERNSNKYLDLLVRASGDDANARLLEIEEKIKNLTEKQADQTKVTENMIAEEVNNRKQEDKELAMILEDMMKSNGDDGGGVVAQPASTLGIDHQLQIDELRASIMTSMHTEEAQRQEMRKILNDQVRDAVFMLEKQNEEIKKHAKEITDLHISQEETKSRLNEMSDEVNNVREACELLNRMTD
eukprot:TRINITY_DN4758_c0_g1_i2.p1 TRINITY_DN4758_c0_g1~~TRINITY_DN4758_c0_g1_i2.p1  ORF type:complete len:679 (+),score=197.27 TRINITY_DN4758_c0_g1_i2:361-2397(+)